MPIAIIGSGYVGRELSTHLGSRTETVLLSARDIIAANETWLDKNLPTRGALVFAQGRSVNIRGYYRQYDEILASRVVPLERLAARVTDQTVILISSTTAAGEGRPKSLPLLQQTYERRFEQLFGTRKFAILRVGTLVGPGTQFSVGLEALSRTRLLKRLRSCSLPQVHSADIALVASAVEATTATAGGEKWNVLHKHPLDLNQALDEICRDFRFCLPQPIFAAVWRTFGVRSDFFEIDPYDLNAGAWRNAPT